MKKQKNHSEIYKIDGVGVNLSRFYPCSSEEKSKLRSELGFSDKDFILIYTAEFIPRKNHKLIFEILPELKKSIPSLKVIFCGKGELLENFKKSATEKTFDFVIFTGYTKQVDLYYRISDVCISASLQEGQGLNLVESMASALPLVASNIRGHKDVLNNGWNGILCDLENPKSFTDAIILLYKNPMLRLEMGRRNVEEAKKYSVDIAVQNMAKIYESVEFNGGGYNCRVIFYSGVPATSGGRAFASSAIATLHRSLRSLSNANAPLQSLTLKARKEAA